MKELVCFYVWKTQIRQKIYFENNRGLSVFYFLTKMGRDFWNTLYIYWGVWEVGLQWYNFFFGGEGGE